MSKLLHVMRQESYKPPATTTGTLLQKLSAAKEFLGCNWILHPEYKFKEKHRFYPPETKNES